MFEVYQITKHYLEEAALLFIAEYRRLRSSIPGMPRCHEAPSSIMPLLSDLAAHSAGAVALSDGKLVGYLLGMYVPEFKSPYPGVYCPEWAHAVVPGYEDVAYTALFQYVAPYWVHVGARSFAVTVLAPNQPAIDAWFWNGFGLAVIDAVRSPIPIDADVPPGMHIRLATSDDVAAVTTLLADHNRYMITPPVSLVVNNDISPECILDRITRPGHAIWLAEVSGEAIGVFEVSESVSGASDIVSGGRGIGIKCTHVLPAWRSKGVASALLNTALTWASKRDVEICSVDFEAFNPTARRFWLRYFSPVCFSFVRRIDERSI